VSIATFVVWRASNGNYDRLSIVNNRLFVYCSTAFCATRDSWQGENHHASYRQGVRTAGTIEARRRGSDAEAMAPARRERFAFLCSRWANVARVRETAPPKSGVLARLGDGERSQ
jgi:hypothetical protein